MGMCNNAKTPGMSGALCEIDSLICYYNQMGICDNSKTPGMSCALCETNSLRAKNDIQKQQKKIIYPILHRLFIRIDK